MLQVKAVFIRNRVLISWRFMPQRRVRIFCNAAFHALKEQLTGAKYRPYSEALKRLTHDK